MYKLALIGFWSIFSTAVGIAQEKAEIEKAEKSLKTELESLPFKHLEWDYKFDGRTITRLTLIDDILYAETNDNRLYAIDRKSGVPKWIYVSDAPLQYPPVTAASLADEIASLMEYQVEIKRFIAEEQEANYPRADFIDKIKARLKEVGDAIASEGAKGANTQSLQEEKAKLESVLESEKVKKSPDVKKIDDLKKKLEETNQKIVVALKNDNLYFVAKDNLFCIDRRSGKLIWQKRLDFTVSAQPFAIRTYVFVPSIEYSRVYVLDVSKEGKEVTYYRAISDEALQSDVTTQPVYSDPNLMFVSNSGTIFAYSISRGTLSWSYRTLDKIKAAPTPYTYKPTPEQKSWQKFLFVGGQDFSFYAFDVEAGALAWRYEAGVPIKETALVRAATVYVRAEDGFLYAFNVKPVHRDDKGVELGPKRGGELRWKLKGSRRFLLKSGNIVYILSNDDKVVAVDEMSGKVKGQYKVQLLRNVVTNTLDESFYVATDNRIYALKEEGPEEF